MTNKENHSVTKVKQALYLLKEEGEDEEEEERNLELLDDALSICVLCFHLISIVIVNLLAQFF